MNTSITENKIEFPETLLGAIQHFANPDTSLAFMVSLRWSDGVIRCPRCQSDKNSFLSTRRLWKCKECAKQFSVKVGTIFEDSPLGLEKWLPAVWVIVNAKNGVSSCELARSLGVTQKTAWFMLHRIRIALAGGSFVKNKMTGTVESDETFVGGRAEFMHGNVKRRRGIRKGNGWAAKTAVMGILQRPTEAQPVSKVFAAVLPKMPSIKSVTGKINENVEAGTEVHTDASPIYAEVRRQYVHKVVDHAQAYVQNNVHTNGLENFWCLLKRAIKGTYVSVEPFHLFRYVTEQVFRFNERKDAEGDKGRFLTAMAGIIGKRLTWKNLTSEDGLGLPATA